LIQTDRNFQDEVPEYCTAAFSVNVKVYAGNRQNHRKCFFVLRFDLILDGDCTGCSQFDKITYAVPAWLA